MAASSPSSSTVEELPPQDGVFINFRGADLRLGFVSHLVKAFKDHNIKVYFDDYEDRGQPIEILLTRIEESRVALTIFSGKYTESIWCLEELAKIKDCVQEGKLVAIPIFYRVDPSTVSEVTGKFGDTFRALAKGDERKKKWKKALETIPEIMGITLHTQSNESKKITKILAAVKIVLSKVQSEGSQIVSLNSRENINCGTAVIAGTSPGGEKNKNFGIKQRLKELKEKLDQKKYKGTRIIGVVGMPGIGKTALVKELFEEWKRKFTRHALIDDIREKYKFEFDSFPALLLEKLLPELNSFQTNGFEEPQKAHKGQLHKRKVLVVLDDVSRKEQIYALLGRYDIRKKHEWLKDGSRIVIATNDMSLIEGLVHDTYVVRQLNHRDGLDLFCYHAFDDGQANIRNGNFMKLSEEFVHYARGHPLALKLLGTQLYDKDMKHWKSKLNMLAQSPRTYIGEVLQVSYDELSTEEKEAFLDIACFRSEDVDYVESLLASSHPSSAENAVKVLENKFLVNTCDGRVEMHDLLYAFSRELDPKASTQYGSRQRRLWLQQDIIKGGVINVLQKTMSAPNVRGIFLDLSEVKDETSLEYDHFRNMSNLRYLKFYNSHCPQECNTKNKINIPDELELPLEEIRCLHWLKFPLEELPNDFKPINLVDLKLPYSEIEQLWEDIKDTPVLKWVDLSHSSKLSNLSGLSTAQKLQSLNLEGCTSLESLGDVNLISLKTLTLSNCSSFKEFPLVSENLEALYLDGTAISQLPDKIVNLERLILLNMKDCQELEKISTCVGELKALKKVVLSGCFKLKEFPEVNKSSIIILLLDGTSIKTMPQLLSVQYLCLSRNDHISCLPSGISRLSQLTWLDLKYCTSLTSVPELPPNLQRLDAHGCSSLKTVGRPLAHIIPAVQNHCTFCFTNCDNLEPAAKEEISSYAQRKCQFLSDARKHYNGGLISEPLFSICFPGCEVPFWFCHWAVGSQLQCKLLPHWHDKRLSGISLCAVVSLPAGQDNISCFLVTCTFNIQARDKSGVLFSCTVGSWTREGDKDDKIETDHVFISYISCPHTIRCLEDENSAKCSFTDAFLEFTVTGDTSERETLKVLGCGLNLVYAKDNNKISSRVAKYDMPVECAFKNLSTG